VVTLVSCLVGEPSISHNILRRIRYRELIRIESMVVNTIPDYRNPRIACYIGHIITGSVYTVRNDSKKESVKEASIEFVFRPEFKAVDIQEDTGVRCK
jgi:hypothetical protein